MKSLFKSLAVIAAMHTALYPCGPFFEKSPMIDPDGASRSYTERMREPGVVHATFKSDYLALLYLPLSGQRYDARALALAASVTVSDEEQHALEEWYKARKAAFPELAEAKVTPYKPAGEYRYATNCHADALRHARELLAPRAKTPYGKFWLQNQDVVFANCGEKKGALTQPAKDASQAVKNDFLYHESALYFYREEYDKAFAGFEALAKNGSAHRDIARYMMIRTRMRQTGAFDDFKATTKMKLAEAEKLVDTLIGEITDPGIKVNAKKLRKIFDARRDERLYAKNLIRELATGNPVEVAHEFRYLFRKWQYAGNEKMARYSEGNDLMEWMRAFQAQDATSLAVAERQYKETKKTHWLVAVLSKLTSASPQRDFYLKEAARVTEENPAFTTVAFYRLALDYDTKLAVTLEQKLEKARDMSSLNALKAVKLRHAQSWAEAATLLERRLLPVNNQKPEHDFGFDGDAARLLTEHASLKDYQALLQASGISAAGKIEIARVGWVRSALLNAEADAKIFASYLRENDRTLGKLAAQTNAADKFLLTLMRNPGLVPYISGHHSRGATDTIDSFRENWWCRLGANEKENTGWDHYRIYSGLEDAFFAQLYPASLAKPYPFAKGKNEFARIHAEGNAAMYFSKRIFAAAEKDPKAEWLAEALHHLVRVTRYGCDFPEKGKISKKAFTLLHKNFKDSEWAKKTPYWFN